MELADILAIFDKLAINDLEIDSRRVRPGCLFLAMPGERVDGRQFIAEALAKGAAAVLVEAQAGADEHLDARIMAVPNLRQMQAQLAAHFYQYPTRQLDVVAITGTNGKTSVAHFLAQAWHHLDETAAVMGTLGNGIYPELAQTINTTMDVVSMHRQMAAFVHRQAKHVAMEVSSHAIVQGRIAELAMNTAVFTNLSQDHLDYHVDMPSYAAAKMQLFTQPGIENGVVNLDDSVGVSIALANQPLNLIGYRMQPPKSGEIECVYAQNIKQTMNGMYFDVCTPWGNGQVCTPLLGKFNISNLLAVACVLGLAGCPFTKIQACLQAIRRVTGRMHTLTQSNHPTVIVDYAHTPDALAQVLQTAAEHCAGQLWCVFGCGGERDRGKRALMAVAAETYADHVIVTHDNPRFENKAQIMADIKAGFTTAAKQVSFVPERAEAIALAVQSAQINDIVLIAGKGHESTQIVGDQVLLFSDIEQAQLQLASYCND